jgi:hypothetical protein
MKAISQKTIITTSFTNCVFDLNGIMTVVIAGFVVWLIICANIYENRKY